MPLCRSMYYVFNRTQVLFLSYIVADNHFCACVGHLCIGLVEDTTYIRLLHCIDPCPVVPPHAPPFFALRRESERMWRLLRKKPAAIIRCATVDGRTESRARSPSGSEENYKALAALGSVDMFCPLAKQPSSNLIPYRYIHIFCFVF